MTERRWEPLGDAVAPGELLRDELNARGMTQVELARRLQRTPKNVNQIVAGIAPITPATAIDLETVLGVSALTWLNLESAYRLKLARERLAR